MEFSVKSNLAPKYQSDCYILGLFAGVQLTDLIETLPIHHQEGLGHALAHFEPDTDLGQTVWIALPKGLGTQRILCVGCGSEPELSDKSFRELIQKTIAALQKVSLKEVLCFLTELPVKNREMSWKVRQIVAITHYSFYRFDPFKRQKSPKSHLKHLTLFVHQKAEARQALQAILEAEGIASGVHLTRDLANCPPNICTPIYLAKAAETLASQHASISVAILDEKEIAALKMGSFLSVAKGSKNPPRLITLEYRGRKDKQKPIVLIGKGITFDTGGNSLKPPSAMVNMKYDMCGAATVLGVLKAAALLELPLNLVGIMVAAENMPGPDASRPDDVVTSLSGLTIEILNTDAEGRLILCDALTYAERFKPETVIDIATLTGATMVALGPHASALFSNHEPLTEALLSAGLKTYDRCWPLPLFEEYHEPLNSAVADIANIGNAGEAGTITAAAFLSRFVKGYHWAHLDIASIAYKGSIKDRSATGRPVALLVQYLLDRVQ